MVWKKKVFPIAIGWPLISDRVYRRFYYLAIPDYGKIISKMLNFFLHFSLPLFLIPPAKEWGIDTDLGN